jgi:hypothetical protein
MRGLGKGENGTPLQPVLRQSGTRQGETYQGDRQTTHPPQGNAPMFRRTAGDRHDFGKWRG